MSVVEVGSRSVVEAPAVVPATRGALLRRAAYLLEEFGWCQRRACARDDSGEVVAFCMGGAAQRALRDLGYEREADSYFVEDYQRLLGMDDYAGWNDDPSRTKAEVVSKLREAAEAAEAS